ncbi:mevalonate kinase [Lactobacillus sp. PV034]|uniref:mevalonate kinase n=1 Tax=Lactobacillus sp. PV034 TaxID=2594495 RepID=UPI0022401B51|nr:mevalonate kinase [Lactobacillus sp. PV034]QNQ80404.1 mevalonate kinase [Lactobacillus sp. PV034]
MKNNLSLDVKAHGKVILIGEHSVVYGKNALAMPIKALNITTTVSPASDESTMSTTHYHGPYLKAPSEYDGLKYVFKTLMEKAKYDDPIAITYTGEIPMERGLGSSAVVAYGTTLALNKYLELNLDDAEIMAITNHAEMINHGKASGIDSATVKADSIVFFNKNDGPKELTGSLGATLLIMDTGELGNTKEAVSLVKQQYEASSENKAKIDQLGILADETKNAWAQRNPQKVGKIFSQAQNILASFGLSTKRIDQISKIAQANGALGTKLSGGGMGGIVISLCPDQETAKKIAHLAQPYFANYWIEEI